jgi:hypothetical protein
VRFRQLKPPRKAYALDPTLFDNMSRSLTESSTRRSIWAGLAASAAAITLIRLPGVAAANKKKRNKPSVNEFGCLNVGQRCAGKNDACCSGICEGKKPKKGKQDKSQCVAHNVFDCAAGADSCNAELIACGTNGFCYQTTGQASFCGEIDGICLVCAKDADCVEIMGAGAACIICEGCVGDLNTACLPPAA